MAGEAVLAAYCIAAAAAAFLAAWVLRGSRLEGIRQWIGDYSFLRGASSDVAKLRSNVRTLARTVSVLQKSLSEVRLQLKAAAAEINAGPSVHSFCTLRERVDRLECGWVTASSVKRILDANENNLRELRGQIELLYRKVDGLNGNLQPK